MSLRAWVPAWWARQTGPDRQLIFALACVTILLPLGGGLRAWRAKLVPRCVYSYLPLYLAGGLGAAFWFFQAPDMRFGYVFLGALLILEAAPLLRWLVPKGSLGRIAVVLAVAGLCLYQGASLWRLGDLLQVRPRLLLPAPYPVVQLVQRTLGGFQTWMPAEGDQCWYAPLPCTPTHNPQVHLRGASLQEGFLTIFKP